MAVSGCQIFAIIFQIFAGIIWISAVLFTIYFVRKSISEPEKKCCKYKTCYQCFFDVVKYLFIIISLPIPLDDTINMQQECRILYGESSPNYGTSAYDALSNSLFVLQFLMILTLSFMKAHWTFRNTGLRISQVQLILIGILNVSFWIIFFGLACVTFMIPDLDILVSYTLYMFIMVMYIAMTIWAQMIFNSKMNQLAGCERKDEQLMHLIIKHKLLTRCILWFIFIDSLIGALHLMLDIKWMWYVWQILIFINIMVNTLCMMLTYRVVGNVYDVMYKSVCNGWLKACCLCSFCCCSNAKQQRAERDIDIIVSGTSTTEMQSRSHSIGTGTTSSTIQ